MGNIINDLSHLPRNVTTARPPNRDTLLMRQVAEAWYDQEMAKRVPRTRAIEELPLRASELSVRCDRQYWYVLTNAEETDPTGPAGIWRFKLGQIVHDEFDEAITGALGVNDRFFPGHHGGVDDGIDDMVPLHGWVVEDTVDLRPAGIPGSSHGDAVLYEFGKPMVVAELKSLTGYPFKLKATNMQGPPEGPEFEHILQAAFTAVALGAPTFIIGYMALEVISETQARKAKLGEFDRFTAEWQFETEDFVEVVAREAARQRRLLAMALRNEMPTRTLDDPKLPAGAFVDRPGTGAWLQVSTDGKNIRQSGTTWRCDYCRFRTRCIEDGAESTAPVVDQPF